MTLRVVKSLGDGYNNPDDMHKCCLYIVTYSMYVLHNRPSPNPSSTGNAV